MKIESLSISRSTYDFVHKVSDKIDYEDWVSCIEKRLDVFTWIENTKSGIRTLSEIDSFDEEHKKKILNGHNKRQACLFYEQSTEKYSALVSYTRFGIIDITLEKKIDKNDLLVLFSLATELNSLLLSHGNKILDEAFIKAQIK